MNKKTIIILSIFAIIIASLAILSLQKQKDTTTIQNDEVILFEKSEGWGPCPPNSICHQSTKLYYSGKLVLAGEKELQKQLSQEIINDLIKKIKVTGVMDKDCSSQMVLDYGATYKLNIDGQGKTIQFPGCEEELREIEKLIPTE
jgi:hypothetical protein